MTLFSFIQAQSYWPENKIQICGNTSASKIHKHQKRRHLQINTDSESLNLFPKLEEQLGGHQIDVVQFVPRSGFFSSWTRLHVQALNTAKINEEHCFFTTLKPPTHFAQDPTLKIADSTLITNPTLLRRKYSPCGVSFWGALTRTKLLCIRQINLTVRIKTSDKSPKHTFETRKTGPFWRLSNCC